MMDWIMIREPFFRTAEEAEQYVTRELPPAVPEGWRIERSSGERLTWIVARTPTNSRGGWENYRVEVSRGLDFVIFFWGNSDHGGFGLHHVLGKALVIETRALRGCGLGQCLRSLFENYPPNQLGLT
jgi:hypothetical protein